MAIRNYLRQNLAKIVEEKYGKPDVIAGVATGAIAIGVLVAEELGVPFVYVRPEPKKHGRQNKIEGYIEKGQNVVIIEDLISTGKSSLNAVKALNELDVKVKGMVAIFSYGFEFAANNFKDANVELTTMSDYNHLLEQAIETNYIAQKDLKTLENWRINPDKWS